MRSVRARTALAAAVTVAVVVGVAVAVGLVVQWRLLVGHLEAAARTQVQTVSAQLLGGATPSQAVRSMRGEGHLLQVLDPHGRVLAASAEMGGRSLLGSEHLSSGVYQASPPPLEGERALVVVVTLSGTGPGRYILAAQPMDDVVAAQRTSYLLVGVGYPLLVALAAAMGHQLGRRALRPVEQMRAELDSIGSDAGGAQVAVLSGDPELVRLGRTMNSLLDRLDRSRRNLERFVADASHELRSPVAAIRTVSEVALATRESTDWLATSHTVIHETERLEALIADMLLLARLGEMRSVPVTVDLVELARSEASRPRRVPILVMGEPRACVSGDPQALRRVLRNLIDNADRHAASVVHVAVRRRSGQVEVDVIDDGEGIPVADRDRVFERFVRLDSARSRQKGGTGLGLAIVRDVLLGHRGEVRVLPVQSGCSIRITVPEAEDGDGAGAGAGETS